MIRASRFLGLACGLAALTLAGCDQPPVRATSDDRQHRLLSRIEGELVVTGRTRGNALVLLYDSSRPPPPDGTGRPLAFTFVPAAELFGTALNDTTQLGPFTAPYALSQVPPGKYLVRGFIDAYGGGGTEALKDRVPDFNPWFGVTSDVNKGDLGGAAVIVGTSPAKMREIVIAEAEDGSVPPATGVTVVFQEPTTIVPADRPAFSVTTASPVVSPTEPMKVLQLTSAQLYGSGVDQRAPMFFVRYIDNDNNLVPDVVNGVTQVWPKVLVRKLADSDPAMLTDENDLDRNGLLDSDPTRIRDYPHAAEPAAIPPDGKPDLVILAAGWAPTAIGALLNNTDGTPKTEDDPTRPGQQRLVTVPTNALTLVVQPSALDVSNPAAPARLASLPKGKYSITVLQLTGQNWRVPNELNPALHEITGLPEVASQAFVLTVE